MPIGLLMLLLPISISGFGLPQGVIVWLLGPSALPDAQSFALSTLIVADRPGGQPARGCGSGLTRSDGKSV